MKKKTSLWILLIVYASVAHAQKKHGMWQADLSIFDYFSDILKPETRIDTVNYSVVYRQKYRFNPDKKEYSYKYFYLDVGKRYSKFYNVAALRGEMRHTQRNAPDSLIGKELEELNREAEKLPAIPPYPIYYQPQEILCDYRTDKLYFTDRIPNPQKGFIFYEEDIPTVQWKLEEEEPIEIAGHLCYKATTRFRGREWIAHYATDIPFAHLCVWKLRGVPGLILKLQDAEEDFTLECVTIFQKQTPLWKYKRKGKRMTFEKWQKMVRMYHEDAKATLLGDNYILYKGEIGHFVEAKEWKVPYNPLER